VLLLWGSDIPYLAPLSLSDYEFQVVIAIACNRVIDAIFGSSLFDLRNLASRVQGLPRKQGRPCMQPMAQVLRFSPCDILALLCLSCTQSVSEVRGPEGRTCIIPKRTSSSVTSCSSSFLSSLPSLCIYSDTVSAVSPPRHFVIERTAPERLPGYYTTRYLEQPAAFVV